MALGVMFLLVLLTGYVLAKINRLGKLEIMAIGLFFMEITGFYYGLITQAAHLIALPTGAKLYAFRLLQFLLLPLVMLIYINLLARMAHWQKKIVLTLLWTGMLVSGDYLLEQIEIYRHINYPIWLSAGFSLFMQLLALVANRLFQHLLTRRTPYV